SVSKMRARRSVITPPSVRTSGGRRSRSGRCRGTRPGCRPPESRPPRPRRSGRPGTRAIRGASPRGAGGRPPSRSTDRGRRTGPRSRGGSSRGKRRAPSIRSCASSLVLPLDRLEELRGGEAEGGTARGGGPPEGVLGGPAAGGRGDPGVAGVVRQGRDLLRAESIRRDRRLDVVDDPHRGVGRRGQAVHLPELVGDREDAERSGVEVLGGV